MQDNKPIRLDKAVSKVCKISRTDAVRLIRRGFVEIDGEIIKAADKKYDFNKCKIRVNGVDYSYRDKIYIMMNKQPGVVCTSADDELSVLNFLPDELYQNDLFTIGRLDKDTTGLLLITNDGELAHKIISPKKHIFKKYSATLENPLSDSAINNLLSGVTLNDGELCKAESVNITNADINDIEIEITTGKYHQVKRMFAAVGNHVKTLKRLSIGGLMLDDNLQLGEAKNITILEIDKIFVHNT